MRTVVPGLAVALAAASAVAAPSAHPPSADPKSADGDAPIRGNEVIDIEGAPPPPAVVPKPKQRRRLAPPYSDSAIEHDAWELAWLLLDIDATGHVARVKFLHRPGHDLERTAIDTALGLEFAPARDAEGAPVRTYAVWSLEWPSYWWLVARTGFATAIPASAGKVPCKGSGPLDLDYHAAVYRDCSTPDLSAANLAAEPWIDAPVAEQ